MSLITALAVSIGALGGIATWAFLSPFGLGLQIWAAFLAWACFYHCGGKEDGLTTTIVCNVFGAVIAAVTLIVFSSVTPGIDGAIWAGICVGLGAGSIVLGANVPAFSSIPAGVYGFASVAAFVLLKAGTGNLMTPDLSNPLVVIVLSMVIGAIFGYVSERVAGLLVKE